MRLKEGTVTNESQLINEINKYGHKLGYISKENSIVNLKTLEIKRTIASIDARSNYINYYNLAFVPLTIVLSLGGSVVISSIDKYSFNEGMILTAVLMGLLLNLFLMAMDHQNTIKNISYFKNLLQIYLEY